MRSSKRAPRFKIDEEFKNLIPPLETDELRRLEASMREEGCRDPVVIWREEGILVDGHHRVHLCRRHGIKFKIRQKSFHSREDAITWALQAHLARRNLTAFARSEIALRLEKQLAQKAKENMRKGGSGRLQGSQISANLDRRLEMAKAAGVSHDTIGKAKVLAEHADEETKDKLRKGNVSINKAHKELAARLPKPQSRKPRSSASEEVTSNEPPKTESDRHTGATIEKLETQLRRYRCIYVLPPPGVYRRTGYSRTLADDQNSITLEEFHRLPIADIGHGDGGLLWLWSSWRELRSGETQDLLASWGARWVGEIVWDRKQTRTGDWIQSQTDVLVLAVFGSQKPIRLSHTDLVTVEVGSRVSKIPTSFRDLIAERCPGPRVELFGSGPSRGWDAWLGPPRS